MKRQILLRTIVMLTQLPIYLYDKYGTKIETYEIVPRKIPTYEYTLIQETLQKLSAKDFAVTDYGEGLPVKMYGLKGTEYDYLLGPFAYGALDSDKIRNYMRRNHIEDFPRVQLRVSLLAANLVLNILSDGEGLPAGDGIDLLESCLEEDEDIRMYSLVDEELRQSDAFQSNHTQADENVLYRHIEQGNVEYLKKNYDLLYLPHPVILGDILRNEEYIYLKRLSACKNVTQIYDLVKEVHIYCASQVRKKQQSGMTNQYVERCKKLIISRRLETIDLGNLAEEVGISKEYLSKLFKQHEGIPVVEYILNIKVEAACNMLQYSDRQVQEIADYLSFGSLSYFSRIFKKKTGMSPQQYRKEMNS